MQVEASGSRLGAAQLYALLLHRSADATAACGAEMLRALTDLKSAGLVRKIGASVYAPTELERLVQLMPLDIVQAPYNILDRRLDESGWLERLHRIGTEIHVRSAFLQGLLLMEAAQLPRPSRAGGPYGCGGVTGCAIGA